MKFYPILLLFCLACSPKTEQPSLSDDKMARIMADLYVAEAATNGLGGYPKDSLLRIYYGHVLEMHGITKEEYEKNLRLYVQDLPRMEQLVKSARNLVAPDTTKKQ